MGILDKLKTGLAKFMVGRHGVDQLSLALLYLGILLNLLSVIPHLGILSTIALVMMILSIWRIYSRNNTKRWAENQKFVAWYMPKWTKCKQMFTRLKNMRKYLYYDCPNCKSKLKLPRGVGEVTVTCGSCGHVFKKKA